MQIIMRWAAAGCILAASLGNALSPAAAQNAEEAFFKGKTVKIVVGYGPGGGYDVYARMLAPYLGKTLGATVIVENQPGAGGPWTASATGRPSPARRST